VGEQGGAVALVGRGAGGGGRVNVVGDRRVGVPEELRTARAVGVNDVDGLGLGVVDVVGSGSIATEADVVGARSGAASGLISRGVVGRHGSFVENPRASRLEQRGEFPALPKSPERHVCSHENCCIHTTIKLLGARNKCLNKRWLPEDPIQL